MQNTNVFAKYTVLRRCRKYNAKHFRSIHTIRQFRSRSGVRNVLVYIVKTGRKSFCTT